MESACTNVYLGVLIESACINVYPGELIRGFSGNTCDNMYNT